MQDLQKAFGERVRKLRLERGLSQEKFAFKIGIHRTYIGMVERAERNVTLSTVYKIAQALDMTISELLSNIESDEC